MYWEVNVPRFKYIQQSSKTTRTQFATHWQSTSKYCNHDHWTSARRPWSKTAGPAARPRSQDLVARQQTAFCVAVWENNLAVKASSRLSPAGRPACSSLRSCVSLQTNLRTSRNRFISAQCFDNRHNAHLYVIMSWCRVRNYFTMVSIFSNNYLSQLLHRVKVQFII